MTKSNIIVVLLIICALFAYADYHANDYKQFYIASERDLTNESSNSNTQTPLLLHETAKNTDELIKSSAAAITSQPKKNNTQQGSLLASIQAKSNLTFNVNHSSPAQAVFRLIPLDAIPFLIQKDLMEIQGAGGKFYVYEIKTEPKKAHLSYQVLQDTALTLKKPTYAINITNKYGNGSYYINSKTSPDTALLTVLVDNKDTIMAFEYPKPLHSFIEQIIMLL